METSAPMMAREPAGSLVVPETHSFRKPRVLVVPSQKETLSVPLAGETEPASFLTFIFCLIGKLWEATIIL